MVLASILKVHGLVVDPVTELRRIYRSTAMQEPVQEAFVRAVEKPRRLAQLADACRNGGNVMPVLIDAVEKLRGIKGIAVSGYGSYLWIRQDPWWWGLAVVVSGVLGLVLTVAIERVFEQRKFELGAARDAGPLVKRGLPPASG